MTIRFLTASFLLAGIAPTDSPADWSHWRGPARDGLSPEKELPKLGCKGAL